MKHWWKILGIVPLIGGIYYACNTLETKKGLSLEEKVESGRSPFPEENQRTSRQQKEAPKYRPKEEARAEINKYLEQKKQKSQQKVQPPTSKPMAPDYTLPEDDAQEEEYPPYYIQPEERDYSNDYEFGDGFHGALAAGDYKAAETYIEDFPKYFSALNQERKTVIKNSYICVMAFYYKVYLLDVTNHCEEQDALSVLRKVIWMNSFLQKYNNYLTDCTYGSENGEIRIYPEDLIKKGEKALEKMMNCPKDE